MFSFQKLYQFYLHFWGLRPHYVFHSDPDPGSVHIALGKKGVPRTGKSECATEYVVVHRAAVLSMGP